MPVISSGVDLGGRFCGGVGAEYDIILIESLSMTFTANGKRQN